MFPCLQRYKHFLHGSLHQVFILLRRFLCAYNNLIKFVCSSPINLCHLNFQNQSVFSEDEVGASKVLFGFAKDHKITVKSGVVGGQVTDAKELEQLSKLPNKLGMVSMLLSVMQAPIRGLACAIKAVSEKEE